MPSNTDVRLPTPPKSNGGGDPPRPVPTTSSIAAAAVAASNHHHHNNNKRRHQAQQEEDDKDETTTTTAPAVAAAAANKTTSTSNITTTTTSCPYLDTIQRSFLDFDLEPPTCSVTLQTGPHNIYACLVCGKHFAGRGPQTPAYIHAVEESHYCFVHLSQQQQQQQQQQAIKFYCLPDNYEIIDASLQDIRAALHPTFSENDIAALDQTTTTTTTSTSAAGAAAAATSRDLFGRPYLPGFVGMSNLQTTDCINAVVQALAHVPPLRDYFLRQQTTDSSNYYVDSFSAVGKKKKTKKHKTAAATAAAATTPLFKGAVAVTDAFGQVVRKLWSKDRFKSHVDPHLLIQAISTASSTSSSSSSHKRFAAAGQQVAADEFLAWLLHQLHIGTGGGRSSSIIHQLFQGQIQVTTRRPAATKKTSLPLADVNQDDREGSDEEIIEEEEDATNPNNHGEPPAAEFEETSVNTYFLQLTLDIPEKPLFRDEDGGLVIPQEPLSTVLQKFDGMTFVDALSSSSSSSGGVPQRKRYRLLKLPDYLILHLARFKTNRYSREKNPTIVAFPVKNLDLSAYTFPPEGKATAPTEEQVRKMSVKELKEMLLKYGQVDLVNSTVEKKELVQAAVDFAVTKLPDLLADKYDLVANITHESPADVGREGKVDPLQEGSYKCHVQHRGTKQWYELQDLHVQEIMPQQIGLSESYVLIFERTSVQVKRGL